jgi:hypothetical protein
MACGNRTTAPSDLSGSSGGTFNLAVRHGKIDGAEWYFEVTRRSDR